jgi:uncharacterized protein YndB with AHSA1/START domain
VTELSSVILERVLPEKVWRALTQPHLMAEWLAPVDFAAECGHRFDLAFDWGKVMCEVQIVEHGKRLAYTWDSGILNSTVTWTLDASRGGTRLRLEQTGFDSTRSRYFQGARAGWPRFLDALKAALSRLSRIDHWVTPNSLTAMKTGTAE